MNCSSRMILALADVAVRKRVAIATAANLNTVLVLAVITVLLLKKITLNIAITDPVLSAEDRSFVTAFNDLRTRFDDLARDCQFKLGADDLEAGL